MILTAGLPEDPRDDSDESSFSLPVTLEDHTAHVRAMTEVFAKHLGLQPSFQHDLKIAADAHDLGKSDPRFQAMLYGGRDRRPGEPALAKSASRTAGARRRAAALAGWPPGERHEFVSAALLGRSEEAPGKAFDWELVVHLVGAHHGFGRPFPPLTRHPVPIQVRATLAAESLVACSDHELYRLESGWLERFWRLIGRYGYWGLAYLEAVLRRADCVASRKEGEGLFND